MHIDKITLDTSDSQLAEYFSRKEAGDTCTFRIKASLDEHTNKMAVLSVEEVEVEDYSETDQAPVPGPEDLPEEPVLKVADGINLDRTLY